MSLIELELWSGGEPLFVHPEDVRGIAPCWKDHDASLVDLRNGKYHKVLGTSREVHTKVFGPPKPESEAA